MTSPATRVGLTLSSGGIPVPQEADHYADPESCIFMILPPEILVGIFEGLTRKDLSSLSSSCRSCYRFIKDYFLMIGCFVRLSTQAEGKALESRLCHSSFVFQDRIYIHGGDAKLSGLGQPIQPISYYDVKAKTWKTVQNKAPIRTEHVILPLPGNHLYTPIAADDQKPADINSEANKKLREQVFLFGGYDHAYFKDVVYIAPRYVEEIGGEIIEKSEKKLPGNKTQKITTKTQRGVRELDIKGKRPRDRSAYRMVLVAGKFFLMGGWNGLETFNDIWSYNPASETWDEITVAVDSTGKNSAKPSNIRAHAIAALDDDIYIFGGVGPMGSSATGVSAENKYYNSLWKFSTKTKVWSEVETKGKKPAPRSRHTMVSYGRMLFVMGGWDGTYTFTDFFVFDVDLGEWQQINIRGLPADGISQHSAVVYDGIMYVHGGSDGQDPTNRFFACNLRP